MKKSKCGHWTHTGTEGLKIGEYCTIWGWYKISERTEDNWFKTKTITWSTFDFKFCPDCGEELG